MDITITVTGVGPLLMHNGRLADPLDPASKALKSITGKRTKTDEDHEEISRIEYLGSLYIDDVGPYLPGDNIWKSLYEAAKKSNDGPRIKEGVLITTGTNPLAYVGPRDSNGLWQDKNFVFRCTVRNKTNRVVRTRPIFQQWWTQAEGILDEASLDLADLRAIAARAGSIVGMGDWRPKFGRYQATVDAA
jgi:hypothetical protein